MGLSTGPAPDQVDPGGDVSPLVRSPDLHLTPVTNVQLVEVVGLEEHVAELGERDPLVASQAGADRLLAQHGPDGYVLADVTEELQDPHVLGPLPVIH